MLKILMLVVVALVGLAVNNHFFNYVMGGAFFHGSFVSNVVVVCAMGVSDALILYTALKLARMKG